MDRLDAFDGLILFSREPFAVGQAKDIGIERAGLRPRSKPTGNLFIIRRPGCEQPPEEHDRKFLVTDNKLRVSLSQHVEAAATIKIRHPHGDKPAEAGGWRRGCLFDKILKGRFCALFVGKNPLFHQRLSDHGELLIESHCGLRRECFPGGGIIHQIVDPPGQIEVARIGRTRGELQFTKRVLLGNRIL